MADITKCKGDGCKDKKTCYRFCATSSEFWQAWFAEQPGIDKSCEYYYEMNEEKPEKKRRL